MRQLGSCDALLLFEMVERCFRALLVGGCDDRGSSAGKVVEVLDQHPDHHHMVQRWHEVLLQQPPQHHHESLNAQSSHETLLHITLLLYQTTKGSTD